ncbi:hypothetical protein ABEI05_08675 [Erwinia billingiae]|uniref:hypothetical protein n=1 Tax=Erwinia billingiae TaxID=182337 RepID=UPI00320A68F2
MEYKTALLIVGVITISYFIASGKNLLKEPAGFDYAEKAFPAAPPEILTLIRH